MAVSLNALYAKMMFRLDFDKRMNLYRKIASLLRNNFTIMNALERCWQIESKDGRKKNEPFAIALRAWQDGLERGLSFGETVHGWTPESEHLMLSVGDVSRLSLALDNLTSVSQGIRKIKKALFDALSYPAFLLAMTFVIVIMVGLYLVPPLSEAAGGDIVWRGAARSLVALAEFSERYWMSALIAVAAAGLFIWWSLSRLSGRVRVFLDKLPPWNMYKVSVSVSWLMSLAVMVASGTSLPVALRMLSESGSGYLRSNLEPAERLIENGYNLGQALNNTGRHFPNDEIIGDLEVYADMTEFDKNLYQISNDYMESSVRRMEGLSSILNSVGILLVSAAIAWVVLGTFEMQEQITSALS
ncbi:MAG: type II secretion system F family protein [Rickettsiales bacterium]|jgi:type II secretory pathway component PulF|nr:type II secretion system F family protein [Rickettsiales bacterium]